MAKPTPSRRSSGGLRIALLALTASAAIGAPASASSVLTIGEGAGRATTAAADHASRPRAKTPAECAAAFHAKFDAIREAQFAALMAAASADPDNADPSLPGTLLFPPDGRPQRGDNAAALRTAAELARAQGRGVRPLDANARWIASRIREDLGDFLSQKEAPFLCSGIDEYLDTLRAQAARIGHSPDRLAEQIGHQRDTTRASLVAARAALSVPPVPRPAPADRPVSDMVVSTLRSTVGLAEHDVYGPPMRVAGRQDVRISEGSSDPALPPVKSSEALVTAEDIAQTIRGLLTRAEKAGAISGMVSAGTDPMRTGSTAAMGPFRPAERPALALLADIRPHLIGASALPASDPHRRADLLRALSDLEALDYLVAAAAQPPHPLPAALDATFQAIADARAEACGCKP